MADRVEVHGLADFQRELRKADATLKAELASLNQRVAQRIVDDVQPTSPQQAKVSKGIKAAKQFKAAVVSTANTRANPFAVGAFFGARRYKQFQPWIGNQWDPGDSVAASYGVPHSIAKHLEDIVDMYGDGIEEIAAKAFPD